MPEGNFVPTSAPDLPISSKRMTIEAKFCRCPPNPCGFPPNGCRSGQNFPGIRLTSVDDYKANAEGGKFCVDVCIRLADFRQTDADRGKILSMCVSPLRMSAKLFQVKEHFCRFPQDGCRRREVLCRRLHLTCRFPPNGWRLRQNFAEIRKTDVEGRRMEAETGMFFKDIPIPAEEFLTRGVVFVFHVERRTIIVVSHGKGTGI